MNWKRHLTSLCKKCAIVTMHCIVTLIKMILKFKHRVFLSLALFIKLQQLEHKAVR